MTGPSAGVVVGYDGTPSSSQALDWAAAEAQRRELPLTVLHVVDFRSLVRRTGPHPWPDVLEREGRELVEQGARRARATAVSVDITAQTHVARVSGKLIAASDQATMLVVGTRGRAEPGAAALGSVASSVSSQARCPCVVVRGDSSEPPGPDRPVVVGVDGSPSSAEAVFLAAGIAAEATATLQLVSAYRAPAGRSAATAHLRGAARRVLDRHPELRVEEQVLEGPTVPLLQDAAHGAGLLVLGRSGHGALAGLVLGSTVQGALRTAPCPVLVVPRHRP